MVPGVRNGDAVSARRDQELPQTRLLLFRAREHHEPLQGRRTGGIDLPTRDPPAIHCPACHRLGQTAAEWSPELGLNPQRIDQAAPVDGIAHHLEIRRLGPAALARKSGVLNPGHAQDQRRCRIGGCETPGDRNDFEKVRSAAAELARNRERDEMSGRRGLERSDRYLRRPIAFRRVGGEHLRQLTQPVGSLQSPSQRTPGRNGFLAVTRAWRRHAVIRNDCQLPPRRNRGATP